MLVNRQSLALRAQAGASTSCRPHVVPASLILRKRAPTTSQASSHAAFSARIIRATAANLDLDALGLDIPDIDGDKHSVQAELGAEFDDAGVPRTFRNARQAIDAVATGVVLVDRSHWGRLRLTGKDRLDFLHNQSTAAFKGLKPGQGCDTVFVTPTARALDMGTALVGESHVMLLVSPGTKEELMQKFDRVIFPADDVKVSDVSDKCHMLSLIGPEAENVLKELGGDAVTIIGAPYGTHQLLKFSNGPVIVAVGSGLAAPGFTLIADEAVSGDLFGALTAKGCVLMGEDEWEVARVLAGRPAPGSELTQDYNPLEAGLYHAVSVTKGCYVGQETISKLHNLDGVKQQLWGLSLQGPAAVGAEVTSGGEKIGRVTSAVTTPSGQHFALAYLRCKSKGAQVDLTGLSVEVAGSPATVTPIPFASRCFYTDMSGAAGDALSALGPGAETMAKRAAEARRQKEAEQAAAAKEKAEKLEAMAARLAAWQAQQLAAAKPPAPPSS